MHASPFCSQCGAIAVGGPDFRATPIEGAILRTIVAAPEDGATMHDLVASVYASDPEGGPLWARKSLNVTLGRLRRKLAQTGWSISSTRRGRDTLYRLHPPADSGAQGNGLQQHEQERKTLP